MLLYESQPLGDAAVALVSRDAPDRVVKARTDFDGRVAFRLPAPGVWMLTSIHMVRADEADADWESLWASLTFEIPADGGDATGHADPKAGDARGIAAPGLPGRRPSAGSGN